MEERKISVIVPVYNTADYLDKCIASIAGQRYRNLEILLVDDGSQDNSGAICDEWARRDARIVVIHRQNGGQAAARNMALDRATGELFGFVDSDDIIDSDMFEVLEREITRCNADIAICDMRESAKIAAVEPSPSERYETRIMDNYTAMRELVRDENVTSHLCNKLFKAYLFMNIRFPAGKVYEDIAVMHEVFHSANTVVYVKKALYNYLERGDSTWHRTDPQALINYFDALMARYRYLAHIRAVAELIDEALAKAVERGLASARVLARRGMFKDIAALRRVKDAFKQNKTNILRCAALNRRKKIRACCLIISIPVFRAVDALLRYSINKGERYRSV